MSGVASIELPLKKLKSGKVREVFELDDERLLIVATDRVSAFDFVLHPPIPQKGVILTRISRFWFEHFSNMPNHIVSFSIEGIEELKEHKESLEGRVMLVRRAKVIPFEFIVRGYLAGSLFESYRRGELKDLPEGLSKGAELAEPLFTPTTKAEKGHDEPCTQKDIEDAVGADVANRIIENSLRIYDEARKVAQEKGIILADTKFEWGFINGGVALVDELLTPDSSRYWDAVPYGEGRLEQFDKQIVRDYLLSTDWDRKSEPPELPQDIVERTRQRYLQLMELLVGERV